MPSASQTGLDGPRDAKQASGTTIGRKRMSGGLRLVRLLIALLVVAVVGVSITMVVARNHPANVVLPKSSSNPTGIGSVPGPSPTIPPRVVFIFPPPEIVGVTVVGGGGLALSTQPAQLIQAALSSYYDKAFVDPASWVAGVPDEAWNAFDASVRGMAKKDESSLALGVVPDLASLIVTKAKLTVHVLLDAKDKPEAAVADVTFNASGVVADGGLVTVTNKATFLFRLVGKDWLIVGYPKTTTTVTTTPVSPSPTPALTPTLTPTAGPTP